MKFKFKEEHTFGEPLQCVYLISIVQLYLKSSFSEMGFPFVFVYILHWNFRFCFVMYLLLTFVMSRLFEGL